ncbi:MAG: SLBB domain-containing protein [Candidatus Kapaibacteriota bacterium]|jgi:protein involved in polysaccharide export with SLBB domain
MKRILWALILFSVGSKLFSQVTGLPTLPKDIGLDEQVKNQFQQQLFSEKETYPTTALVIDTFYYVGPGDIISILVLPTSINTEITKISSDGQLILSRYGFLDVKGKTLLETKKELEKLIKAINSKAEISVSLYKPRICLVRIYGNVKKPGVYNLPASYRVSDAIAIANLEYSTQEAPMPKISSSMMINDIERKRESELTDKGLPANLYFSNRNIFVYNQIWGLRKADIELSKSRNSFEFDPYIREGDEIYVPYTPINYEYVTISGAIVQPGKFFFKKGDKFSDLIQFAKGFKNNADLSNIVVLKDGFQRKISLEAKNVFEQDFELEPFTNIIVGELPTTRNNNNAVAGIYGCVEKPGVYPIVPGKTRLLDLIKIAGGLICEPSYSKSFVLRSYPQRQFWDDPSLELFSLFKQSNLTLEDTTRFKMDLFTKGHFVSCDLYELLSKNNLQQNILLSDGDLVVLPKSLGSIYVWGQVKNPGYVPFEQGKTYEWYIDKAGGYLSTAKKSRIRIIRGSQKVWLNPKETEILDGDEIYVPGEPDLPPGTEYQYYSLIATGIATLISLTYLIINLTTRRN